MSLLRLRSRGRQSEDAVAGPSSPLESDRGRRQADAGAEADDDAELPSAAAVLMAAAQRAKGKAKAVQETEFPEDDDAADDFSEDLDDSADEWQPASRNPKRGSTKHARSSDDEEGGGHDDFFSEDDDEEKEVAAPGTKRAKTAAQGKARQSKGRIKPRPQPAAPSASSTSSASSSARTGQARTKPSTASSASRQPPSAPLTGTSSSSKPNLGRAAGLAALAAGSNMSAKEIIDRLHQARTLAENEFRRARGEQVVDPVFLPRSEDTSSSAQAGPSPLPPPPPPPRRKEVQEEDELAASPTKAVAALKSAPSAAAGPSGSLSPAAARNKGPASGPASAGAVPISATPPMSVASWLGVVPQDGDLPWPTMTPPEAIVTDRDSLFIGFVFPFPPGSNPAADPSSANTHTHTHTHTYTASAFPRLISTYVSHLIRTVQPALVPVHLLPEHLQSAPAARRGASHDMYAVRTQVLKFGRDGSRGRADWAPWEGADDDGEKWGAQKIAKVIQEENAHDVLVFVSRWYGGTLLGPDRFVHITKVARATLRHHVAMQKLARMRSQLEELDARAASLRATLASAPASSTPTGPTSDAEPSKSSSQGSGSGGAYADLTEVKAQRLLVAKRKMVELLEKKVAEKGAA